MPSDLTTPSAPLPRVAAALAAKRGLNILALGSGSTVGESGGSGGPALTFRAPERSFPYQMAAALRAMRPARPGDDFTISIRVNCNAANVGGMRDALGAYSDAGIQHVMAAPEDRDIDTYLATAEAFHRAGHGL